MQTRAVEFFVGLFVLLGILGLLTLAFKISGLTDLGRNQYYTVTANFDNIGDLRTRSPVRVAGVTVGRVGSIHLDPQTFRAAVMLQLDKRVNPFPVDTSASILTEGLLGSNYISLTPGFEKSELHSGDVIQTTHSALILENLIGQLLYNLKSKS